MDNRQDRRSQRTRHLLSAAFIELMREKGYSAITVSDLIERANIGRSTFYSHYHDKEDLFVSELDRVIDALQPEPAHRRAMRALDADEALQQSDLDLLHGVTISSTFLPRRAAISAGVLIERRPFSVARTTL